MPAHIIPERVEKVPAGDQYRRAEAGDGHHVKILIAVAGDEAGEEISAGERVVQVPAVGLYRFSIARQTLMAFGGDVGVVHPADFKRGRQEALQFIHRLLEAIDQCSVVFGRGLAADEDAFHLPHGLAGRGEAEEQRMPGLIITSGQREMAFPLHVHLHKGFSGESGLCTARIGTPCGAVDVDFEAPSGGKLTD